MSPVSESRVGARALQIAAGCPRAVYWAASYAWDAAMYLGVVVFALATFAAFGDGATTGSAAKLLATALLLLGYGLAAIPQAYLYSLRFSSPSSAQVAVSAVSFLLGFMLVVGSQTMQGIPEAQVGLARTRGSPARLGSCNPLCRCMRLAWLRCVASLLWLLLLLLSHGSSKGLEVGCAD